MGNQVEPEKQPVEAIQSSSSKIIKANVPQNRGLGVSSKEVPAKGKRVANQKRQKMVVSSQDVEINKDINIEKEVLEVLKKNNHEDEDHELIETCLLNHFFMRSLEKQARNEIIREITLFKVKEKTTLFKQGSIGHFFYIIKEGEIDLLINDKKIKTLSKGDSFGELALMHGAPRSGTVISVTSCKLWCMERRNFRKIIEHINDTNYQENSQFIDGINLFSNIDKDLKSVLAKNLIKVFYNSKQNIVKEGDLASCLYIIKEGEVDCVSNGHFVRTLKKGDYFGEKSVLLECKRTMDVNAKTHCICYVISVDALKNMVGEKYISVLLFNFLEMAFKLSKSFNKINPKLFQSFFDIFQLKNYTKGEIVLPARHYIGSAFFIIIEGSLTKNKKDTEFKRGEILFEDELMAFNSKEAKGQKTKLAYDLLADPDCLLMICETQKLMDHLGNSFKEIFNQSSALSSLSTIPLFKHVSQAKLSYLTKVVKVKSFEHKSFIIKQGEPGETFFIVKTGKVDILKDGKYIRTINENESFGFKALFNKEIRSASAVANGAVECYSLSSDDFKEILEEKLISYLKTKMMLEDDEITINDLDVVKDLGVGSFGAVSLVRAKKNKSLYAIKAMNKTQIDVEKLHCNIDLEKGIMLRIDHPFLTKLVKTMKFDNYIFFLMEYNKGKELWDVIRDIGILNKIQTQFYAGSMMLGVDYLHSRRFVHRDIKPENIMILDTGYVKVIDFGTCKEITEKTFTIIGTPHYMAPEAILGEGYSFQVDFWSIGIMMYEFVCGGVPFGEGADEPMEVYKIVVHGNLKFPAFCKDKEFMDIIKKMLIKSPLARLCNLTQIKSHPYFKNFSFDSLINFDIDPPYKSKDSKPDIISESLLKPYTSHLKNLKKYSVGKDKMPDASKQKEYDKWFANF